MTSLRLSPEAICLAESLAPKLGILTSTALYFAPFSAVLAAVRADDMGDLNPLPLCIMAIVSVCWLAYGLAAQDPYVALSNIGGCIGSIGYVVGILPLLQQTKHETKQQPNRRQLRLAQAVIVGGAGTVLSLWTFLGLVHASSPRIISKALGLFASALFIILSASPLSTIRTVLSTRNSKSILGPLTGAQVINTALWSAYGLAIQDRFVWGPNVVGLGLGMVQLTFKLLFPSR